MKFIQILGLTIVLIIIYILYQDFSYHSHVNRFNSSCESSSMDLRNFDNGDLLLFRYDYFNKGLKEPLEFQEMVFTCMDDFPLPFSHIGIVLRIDDIPYVLHIANYARIAANGDMIGNKVDIFKLYDYLNEYDGNVYHSKYDGSFPGHILYKKAEQMEFMPFRFDFTTVINYIFKGDWGNRNGNTISCSGFIIQLMNEVGLLNLKNINYNHYTPNKVFIEAMKTGKYLWPSILSNKFYCY